jgi:deferrochelatase/peroxidase EfeB
MRGGSYLISRRIQIYIENWDRDYLEDQQNVIGRAKVTAP